MAAMVAASTACLAAVRFEAPALPARRAGGRGGVGRGPVGAGDGASQGCCGGCGLLAVAVAVDSPGGVAAAGGVADALASPAGVPLGAGSRCAGSR